MKNSVNTPVNETMNRVNNSAKIEDFGQKIGGARKDYYTACKELAEQLAGVCADDLRRSALSKLVRLPDLSKLVAAGALSADAARAVWTLWRSVAHRPTSPFRLRGWADETAKKVAQMQAIVAGGDVPAELREKTDFRVMTAANWPAEPLNFGRFTVKAPGWFCDKWAVVTGGHYYRKCEKLEEVPAALASVIAQAAAVRAAFSPDDYPDYFRAAV